MSGISKQMPGCERKRILGASSAASPVTFSRLLLLWQANKGLFKHGLTIAVILCKHKFTLQRLQMRPFLLRLCEQDDCIFSIPLCFAWNTAFHHVLITWSLLHLNRDDHLLAGSRRNAGESMSRCSGLKGSLRRTRQNWHCRVTEAVSDAFNNLYIIYRVRSGILCLLSQSPLLIAYESVLHYMLLCSADLNIPTFLNECTLWLFYIIR